MDNYSTETTLRRRMLTALFRIPVMYRPFFHWLLHDHVLDTNGTKTRTNVWWIRERPDVAYVFFAVLLCLVIIVGLCYQGYVIKMYSAVMTGAISRKTTSKCGVQIPDPIPVTEIIKNYVDPYVDPDEVEARVTLYRNLTIEELDNGFITIPVEWLVKNMSLNLFDVGTVLLLNNNNESNCVCASEFHLQINSFSSDGRVFMRTDYQISPHDFSEEKCNFGPFFEHYELMASDAVSGLVYDHSCNKPQQLSLTHNDLCCLKLCTVWNGISEEN